MQWRGLTFVDSTLLFGLRSAPLIFLAVADVVKWVMERQGVSWVNHYIDDFVTLGPPSSEQCQRYMLRMHKVCEHFGLPVEPEKDEGPTTIIAFLGIELHSSAMVIRLPLEKLTQLRKDLTRWRERRACTKQELLSLIGQLSHACKAVRAGRSFLRRLIDLSMGPKRLDHYVRLNAEVRSDIEWWAQYASAWNGMAMTHVLNRSAPGAVVTSDASGQWGCGAYSGPNWFVLEWAGPISDFHITVKELVPIVVAGALWGPTWQGTTVLARCDNTAVVSIINQGTSKNVVAIHIARCLAFISTKFNFHIVAEHVRGVDNVSADALSRNNLGTLRLLYPQANQEQSVIPQSLLDLLVTHRPD